MRASSGKTEPFCGKTEPAPTVYPVDDAQMPVCLRCRRYDSDVSVDKLSGQI